MTATPAALDAPAGVLTVPCGPWIPSRGVAAHMALSLPLGSGRAFVSELTTPAAKRNATIQRVLTDPRRPAWIYFSDADMLPPRDTVLRLLENGRDVVGGLYGGRVRGEAPLASGVLEYAPECGFSDGRALRLTDLSDPLVACDWVGAGALLVRRPVLEALAPGPWFASDAMGENEDMEFCARARRAGFTVYVDTRVRVPHLQLVPIDVPVLTEPVPSDNCEMATL